MAIDPNIALATQPVQTQGSLDSYQKLLSLQNAQSTNALNQE
jgi:hypothetical protein